MNFKLIFKKLGPILEAAGGGEIFLLELGL